MCHLLLSAFAAEEVVIADDGRYYCFVRGRKLNAIASAGVQNDDEATATAAAIAVAYYNCFMVAVTSCDLTIAL